MPLRTAGTRVLITLVAATSMLLAGSAGAGVAPPGSHSNAHQASYWTPQRRAAAIPRDLTVDSRGFGYLQLPSGSLVPYGHGAPAVSLLRALPVPNVKPPGGGAPGGGSDTQAPSISNVDPASGATIGTSYTFTATVTDNVGVKSVTFTVWKDGQSAQTFSASNAGGDSWAVALTGFTDGSWHWFVTAKDTAKKGGNSATSGTVAFSVVTGGGGGGGGGAVANAIWPNASTQIGRLYFEMPYHGPNWAGFVCSGTVVTDGVSGRSIILTAAHCVYDDVNKVFARNVLFIPDQDQTSAAGTDTNCSNDPMGCWAPFGGVVDVNWTTRRFPDNIPWDYAYYMVSDTGAHSGSGNAVLDSAAGGLGMQFSNPGTALTDAIGYSYSNDPDLMYCADQNGTESSYGDWWLDICGLSGGSSGGPWMQSSTGAGPITSLNSWGYTNQPGMAGPKLVGTSASCVFTGAKTATTNTSASC